MIERERTNLAEGVGKIVRALDRAIRSRRLYAGNNPTFLQHQKELVLLLTRHLSAEGDLTLVVEPYALRMGEETVYANSHQQESFAFRLFSDGVRSLTFESGLEESEIGTFLASISSRQAEKPSQDDDAITLFWEKQFEHIHYTVADSIIDESGDEQKSTSERVDEVLDSGMTMFVGSGSDLTENDDFYKEFKITLDPASVGEMFADRCVLAPEELAKIQRDLAESDRPDRLVLDFVDMVLAVLQEEGDAGEYDRIVGVLGTLLETSILSGQFAVARTILEQVYAFPARAVKLAASDPSFLRRTLKTIWPPPRIDLLLQAINQERSGSQEEIETIVSLIDPALLPHLLRQIGTVIDANRKKAVLRGIARLHKGDLGVFLPMVSSKDPDTVRSGLHILSLMNNERIIDLLPGLIQHSHPAIRRDAISILRNFRNPKAYRILLGLLHDPAEETRILSLRIIAASGEADLARQLVGTINLKDFRLKSMPERKAYFQAVAKIVGDDFVPFLRDILDTRNWFASQELNDMYQCAAFALTVLGTPAARDTLRTAARTGNRTVRRLAEAGLKTLESTPSPSLPV